MRKDFGAKPYTYPQPVFIIASYDENNVPDAMNAAWGGISEQDEITLCLDNHHKTVKNILLKKEFTVSMGEAQYVVACDYFGVESGNKGIDKIAKANMHISKAKHVDAPIIDELALCLECRLKSYNEKTCQLIAEIVNVSIDTRVLDENGRLDVTLLEPITFDPINNAYIKLGEKVGRAFKDGLALK